MTKRQQMELMNTCICRETELYGEWARRQGMSYHTLMVLYSLDYGKGKTQKQIAEEWMTPKQTVNTIIKELERRGYVQFEAGEGRKNKKVYLTEEGKRYAGERLKGLYEIEERVLEKMGEALSGALLEGSLAFVNAFEEELANGN